MSSQFKNEAAWIPGKAQRLQVGPGPTPNPAENEVVIKVAYAAINPVDYKCQDAPYLDYDWPFIYGTDVAGTIVQLGSSVTRFTVGQRVIGHCDGLLTQKKTNSGFQLYSTCMEIIVAAVPDSLPLANAAVLPLSVDTAASGLFCHLKMPYPSLNPKPTGKKVLVWGGSSSCGSSAIQLGVAAGYEVATTAGKANFGYVKDLGAKYIFDHSDPNVVDEILKILKPGDLVYDCIGLPQSQEPCAKIVSALGGGKLPIILPPLATLPDNVEGIGAMGLDTSVNFPDVADALWRDYLPKALASGSFQAKPDPFIIKGGLSKVQEGMDVLRKGVSAKKIVIEIAGETPAME